MCHAKLYVETTRDISRQIIRHRSLSVQEYSQRYAVPSQYELSEARLQDPTNRQNSIETDDKQLQHWWMQMQERVRKESMLVYQMAVDHGIAKELARKVLPEGLMVTTMYVTGSIRSWIHYIQVRTDPSTQKEHRIVAEQCREALAQYYPLIFGSKNEVV
jgi:thymidylate synthase (FAD)